MKKLFTILLFTLLGALAVNATDYYLAGTMNNWSTSANKFTGSSSPYTLDISLDGGTTYEFKLVRKSGSETQWRGKDNGKVTSTSNEIVISGTGGNVSLETTYSGTYKFKYDTQNGNKLTVTYPTPPADLATITVTSADDSQGIVSPAEVKVNATQTATITATPKAGYMIDTWTLGGSAVLAEGNLTDASIKVKSDGTTDPGTAVASFKADPDAIVLYFVNKDNWNPVNIYIWGGSVSMGWPGVTMTKTGDKKMGYDIYSYSVHKGDCNSYKFNCGGDACQSSNFGFDENKRYVYDNQQYASLDDILAHTIIIDGSSYGYDKFQLKNSTDDDTYTGSINITGSQYQFKIKADSETRSDETTYTDSFVDKKMSKDQGRTTLTTTVAGEYQFKYVVSTKLLSVTYPAPPADPATITVTSADDSQGSVSPAEVQVNETQSAIITATPKAGYMFDTWTLSGSAVLAEGNLTDSSIKVKSDGTTDPGTAVASFEVDPNVVTLYFVNSIEWSKVNAYLYNAKIKDWPGLEMTKTSMTATSYNYEVWSISFDKNNHTNIIFNNGDGKQTPASMELWNAEKPYYDYNNNAWYASLDDIVPVVPQAHKVFVRGGFNGWDDSFQLKSATGDGVFEGTISWNKNQTYNFKLTVDDAWKSVDKTINETGAFEIPNDGGDMKVATNEYEGDFKFSYDYSSKILTVTYPTDEKVTILVSSDDTDKGTVDKESVEVGKYSTATITALPESGYKLSMWTLTNAVLASGSLTDAAITIKSDGSGLDGTAVASFVEDPDAVVVKYLNTNNWEPVYIHMWGAKETQWHGLPMKNTGEQKYGYDVYSITINKNDYKSCIFNDNGDNKSRNLVFGKDDAQYEPDYSKLVCSQGKWYASLEDVPEPTFQTFYYVNRYNWEMPKIYFYGGDGYGSFTSYPGVDMLKQDGVSVNGCDVYYYNVEEGLFQSYIIGQGTDEDKYEATIDPENLVYYYKGVRFNKLEDIKPLTLVGEFNEWDASANKLEMEDNIGFTSVVLSANKTYKFKILDNGIYLSNSGTMTSDNCTGWTMETDKGDCNIETKNKGEFTFSFDVKTSKLSVTYPEMVIGFSLIINDTEVIDLAKNELVTDYNEYYVHDVEFATGDVLTFLNKYDDGKFVVSNLDRSADLESAVSGHSTGIKVDWQGRYDVYLKMYESYGNNWVYMEGLPILDDVSAPEEYYGNRTGKSGSYIVKRVLDTQSYNTLCLPFSLSAAQIAETPLAGSSILKYVDAVISGSGTSMEATLRFADVSEIEAGKPYLILPAEDILEPMEINDVTISVSEGSTEGDDKVEAVGILKPTHLSGGDPNNLFLGLNNTFCWPASGDTSSLKGMRAYFHVLLPQMIQFKAPAKLQIMAPLPTGDNTPDGASTDDTYKTFNEQNIVIIIHPDGTINTLDGKEVK